MRSTILALTKVAHYRRAKSRAAPASTCRSPCRTMRRRTDTVPLEQLLGVPAGEDLEGQAVDTITAQAAIGKIVELLPADQAEVVLLRVVAGLSAEETGELMGKRPGAVRVLQHRALERLAKDFAEPAVTGSTVEAM